MKLKAMQFRITILGIEPRIWRTIEVPRDYTFWDLHVAIQDAMGWLDYHLHLFTPASAHDNHQFSIGIPDPDFDSNVQAGWEVPIASHFSSPGDVLLYEYDFGDGWRHELQLVEFVEPEPDQSYPRCVAGQRAGPPEDCGGPPGYFDLLEALSNDSHEQHLDYVDWLKNHIGNYHPFDSEAFDPSEVKFDDPAVRFEGAFGSSN